MNSKKGGNGDAFSKRSSKYFQKELNKLCKYLDLV
jgi:hypothetical protein